MGRKSIVVFSLGLFLIIGGVTNTYGQQQQHSYSNYDDCIANFNIENIDFHGLAEEDKDACVNYSYCMAAAKNNIVECDKLPDPQRKECSSDFKEVQGFFIKLLFTKQVSFDLVRDCVERGLGDGKFCQQFLEGVINADDSVCKNIPSADLAIQNNCRAFVTLNEKLVTDSSVKDSIRFMKAVRNLDVRDCDSIRSQTRRLQCQATLAADNKYCEGTKEFRALREKYCMGLQYPGGDR